MRNRFLIIIGVVSAAIIAVFAIGTTEYQSTYNEKCNSDGGYVTGFLKCTYTNEDFSDPRITGKMAREICSITGGECPPNYPANILDDGSMMVGVTIWNAENDSEKSYVFTIQNNTLSYDVKESSGNYNVPIIPDIGKTGSYKLDDDRKVFDLVYSIKGASIEDVIFNSDFNSLSLLVEAVHQGSLEITIPRELLDSKRDYCPPRQENPPDDQFIVLLNREEIAFDEIRTTKENRTLFIEFSENVEKIEIVSTCWV